MKGLKGPALPLDPRCLPTPPLQSRSAGGNVGANEGNSLWWRTGRWRQDLDTTAKDYLT